MSSTPEPMRAVVLGGATGLLGQALVRALRGKGWEVAAPTRAELDLLGNGELADYLDRREPHRLFNAVAYTLVDQAEDEPEQAFLLNKSLPVALGRLSRDRKIPLVHFSTDFVFSGRQDEPYEPQDEPDPASVYGKSKLAGENALREIDPPGLCIVRTAWLFGPDRKNFVRTILALAAEREELNVVHDQVGSPTFTEDLARDTLELVDRNADGLFHLVNSGRASWCELAAEAVSLAGLHCRVRPIASDQYPQKAARPPYSVLSTARFTQLTGVRPRPWAQALRDYVYQEFAPQEDEE